MAARCSAVGTSPAAAPARAPPPRWPSGDSLLETGSPAAAARFEDVGSQAPRPNGSMRGSQAAAGMAAAAAEDSRAQGWQLVGGSVLPACSLLPTLPT